MQFFSHVYISLQENIRLNILLQVIITQLNVVENLKSGYVGIDTTLFKDIWKKHGDGKPIDDFPLVDIFVYKIWYQRF